MSEILQPASFPDRFDDVEALEEFMTRPSQALIDDLARLDGDLMVLGVGGKMGPTLARLAKRAAPNKRVIGVARFSEAGLQDRLDGQDIETIACDLLDRQAVAELPDVKNIVFMAGRKFGSTGAEELTWAMNVHVPANVADRFQDSRIAAFSTGCVYPFTPIDSQGATEATPPVPPPGEYANSCLGRERIFGYFSDVHGTPGRIIRLNYAIDMRYGVLHDVAAKVWAGEPLDLDMGHVNVIWQGDANAQVLRALHHCTVPPAPVNISGPETISIRWLAQAFGKRFGKEPILRGQEATSAWLSNCGLAAKLFGYPLVPLSGMIDWTADWIANDRGSLGKPTHFEARDGQY
ncbi:MAG: NAD-dependent epimerase/dehydratase family protein [Alphaproteobacteria bacterium]|jgi:nucleoside-diphosphate-sugar epimerase|nr:NAD-dependent epimerase/dehydratase family protein [Alphaproteobacteria bacterium]MDP6814230.1 NAD-dependent epimerase/dehydratase family protein [Alphaproteobacteria bacterium]